MSQGSTAPLSKQQHRTIDQVVVHCTASPNGRRLGDRRMRSVDVIDIWHMQRGFARRPEDVARHNPTLPHIGYHVVIDIDGQVHTGRSLREVGAHVEGHNANSVGICLVGGLEEVGRYTLAQWRSLGELHKTFARQLPGAAWCGHRDLNPHKTCPGFDVAAWLASGTKPLPAHVFPAPLAAAPVVA